MPIVVIPDNSFGETTIEEEVLSTAAAVVVRTANLSIPEARELIAKADALMVTGHQVTARFIAGMNRCRIISRIGTGLDAIDVAAATERGIWVTNVPDYSVDEVSTHAIALLLSHVRQIHSLINATRRGGWNENLIRPVHRLKGQMFGVLGFGRIGRAVAAKARGLGLNVIAYDPYIDAGIMDEEGARPADLETLLQTSDFVSLHLPLNDATRQIIDAAVLATMKPTALLVNTSRGGLIDEEALLQAVRSGQIAGAALDVLSVEPPPPEHPLLHEERIMVTPHVGYYSEEAERDSRVRAAEEVVRVLRGERPRSPVNEIDLPR